MHKTLSDDLAQTEKLLNSVLDEANRFLAGLDTRPAGMVLPAESPPAQLPQEGAGAFAALAYFKQHYASGVSGSAGPRYYGLVTGGVTPAALAGDWLVSVYDQNTVGSDETIAPRLELETIGLLRQLFGLPPEYSGSFVTGATMSNFTGLALARQWVGHQSGVDCAAAGLGSIPPFPVFSGTPHSSIYKALAMLGLGRNALVQVDCLPEREAVDVGRLEQQLIRQDGRPCVVVANAGTVNTVDFDDLQAVGALRSRYNFWLHVDAAFGGFAACSPSTRFLTQGIDLADSITIDAHKWLNVPYDAAMQFTRRADLQAEVFQNAAVYLEQSIRSDNFVHLTPENSRRWRALPSWFTLMAYGRQGYAEIVERNCRLARWLAEQIAASPDFELLAPVRLNGICFTLAAGKTGLPAGAVRQYLNRLQAGGTVYLTGTVYRGSPAVRVSITNWRTTQADVEQAWQAMAQAAASQDD